MNTTKVEQKTVPFFNYPAIFKQDAEELTNIFLDIANRGAYILQKDLVEFETNLAKYCGMKYAIGVANGTDAIVIALRAAGVMPGDEVIFCTHTYVATAAAIHFAGAIPIAIDCARDHMMDVNQVEAKITSKTKAILPTQLNGRSCDMEALVKIAKKHNLVIVEDAAQALGATFKGAHVGSFGKAGTISFYPAKTLGCFGDGGAILTNDDEMYEQMMLLRDHGRNADGLVVTWGYNSRLDNLQAAILDFRLGQYNDIVKRRREIADLYHQKLSSLSELLLPISTQDEKDRRDIFQNYEIEADRRNELQAYLKENGIGTIVQWAGTLVHQFRDLKIEGNLPYSENMISRSLLLPIYPTLTNEDVEYVCDKIRTFYKR
ncbi:MAG: DegT/DnrJ/EryC1/StrS family aminotransferase [Candidatus Margulisbacteria bacterium]|nr:DegT/DnrJ/EryC1/StrS family aminotransferase [Candidatus Margulisiibacteriota bacterium]